VGFSYSDVPSDYNVGDVRTAADAYAFLQGFFKVGWGGGMVGPH
jgi:hypothetical protein